jgi:hypothetical protein
MLLTLHLMTDFNPQQSPKVEHWEKRGEHPEGSRINSPNHSRRFRYSPAQPPGTRSSMRKGRFFWPPFIQRIRH